MNNKNVRNLVKSKKLSSNHIEKCNTSSKILGIYYSHFILDMLYLDGPVDLSIESLLWTWSGHGHVMLVFCLPITKYEEFHVLDDVLNAKP